MQLDAVIFNWDRKDSEQLQGESLVGYSLRMTFELGYAANIWKIL